jgi:hypothetical protein
MYHFCRDCFRKKDVVAKYSADFFILGGERGGVTKTFWRRHKYFAISSVKAVDYLANQIRDLAKRQSTRCCGCSHPKER